jgi:hypothetical protein
MRLPHVKHPQSCVVDPESATVPEAMSCPCIRVLRGALQACTGSQWAIDSRFVEAWLLSVAPWRTREHVGRCRVIVDVSQDNHQCFWQS